MTALILDDDSTYLYIIETLLSMQPNKIQYKQLTDPIEALALLNAEEGEIFDTILLDINMPSINGWEFLDELQKLKIHKNVFILTSSADIADLEKSRKYKDIVGYYVKPIKMEQLAAILRYK